MPSTTSGAAWNCGYVPPTWYLDPDVDAARTKSLLAHQTLMGLTGGGLPPDPSAEQQAAYLSALEADEEYLEAKQRALVDLR